MSLHENVQNIGHLLKLAFHSKKGETNYIDEQLCHILSVFSELERQDIFQHYYEKDNNEAFFYREYFPCPESEQYYSLANIVVSSALKKTLIYLINQQYSFNTDTLICLYYCVDDKETEDNDIICDYISKLPSNVQKNILLQSYMKANTLRDDSLRNFIFNNPAFQKLIPNIPLDSMDILFLIRGKNYLLSTVNKIVCHFKQFPNQAYLQKFISMQIQKSLSDGSFIKENLALTDLFTMAISLKINIDISKYYDCCYSDEEKEELLTCIQKANSCVEKSNLTDSIIAEFFDNKKNKRI